MEPINIKGRKFKASYYLVILTVIVAAKRERGRYGFSKYSEIHNLDGVSFCVMPKCDIEIILPKHSFRVGENIDGIVVVRPRDDCSCNELKIDLSLSIGGTIESIILFKGEWKKDEKQSFEFSIPVPNNPHTYTGKLFNIEFSLNVAADFSKEFFPIVEEESVEIEILPAVHFSYAFKVNPPAGADIESPVSRYLHENSYTFYCLVAGVILIGIASLILYVIESVFSVLGFVSALLIIWGLYFFYFGLPEYKSFWMGKVTMELFPESQSEVRCVVHIYGAQPRVLRGEAQIFELLSPYGGKQQKEYFHTEEKLFERVHDEKNAYETRFVIPDGFPYTNDRSAHFIFWYIKLKFRYLLVFRRIEEFDVTVERVPLSSPSPYR